MNNLGKQLKCARELKKWTQKTLSERMNVSRSTISNWENGIAEPDYNTICRLSEVLRCDFMPKHNENTENIHAKERKMHLIFTENPIITINSPGNVADITVATVDFRLNGSDSHGNAVEFQISAGISVISDDD